MGQGVEAYGLGIAQGQDSGLGLLRALALAALHPLPQGLVVLAVQAHSAGGPEGPAAAHQRGHVAAPPRPEPVFGLGVAQGWG